MSCWGGQLGRSFAVVALLAVLSGCATGPRQQPIAWNAEAIAQNSAPSVRLRGKEGAEIGTVQTARVRSIVSATRNIESIAGLQVQVLLVSGEEPNAFAFRSNQGDRIAFTLGMLDLLRDDTDAYAAIIGHELAHLVLDHGAQRKEREATRVGVSTMLGFALGMAGVPMGGTIADLGSQTVTTAFSRDEERDADSYGAKYARQAGYDPYGAVRAWEKMSARASVAALPFLSTHPASAERLETMKRFAASSPQVEKPATQIASARAPSSPPMAAAAITRNTAFARLRPIARVVPGEALPPGDMFVDMRSVDRYPQYVDARQAWLIINLATPAEDNARSISARALVRCPNAIAVIQTIRSAGLNGEGQIIDRSDHTETFKAEKADSSLSLAAKSICE